MGPTGPSASKGAYFFLAFFLVAFFFIVSPPSRSPRVPAVVGCSWTLGDGPRKCQGENTPWRVQTTFRALYVGPGTSDMRGLDLLLGRGRLAMLASLHELLVQGHALLAQGAALGRIRGEIAADETEDLFAADLALLRPTPERSDAHDLSPEVFDELREEADGGAGAHEVLDDEHFGGLPDETVELRGERDSPLAAAHTLGAVDLDGPGGMRAGDAVGEDHRAGAG